MNFESIRLEFDQGLARLTYTQAERGNPVDARFCAEFCEAANIISTDPAVRALLITAEGRNFGVGGDISLFLSTLDSLPLQIKRWTSDLHVGISRLQSMDAPIVAAVQGVCAGGAAGMVAGADIVVAETGARFVAAYAGIGYCCDAGSSIMLSRRMGLARARKFLLLNETLDAQAALAAGLIDEVATADQLIAHAESIARKLAGGPTKAYGEMRRLLTSAEFQPLDTQLELEALALARTSGTADAREGLTAFGEKRKPVFKGQ